MSEDVRLLSHLEVFRLALQVYLAQLRAAWTRPEEPGMGSPEIEGILAAVGVRPDPSERERELGRTLLDRARDERRGALARIVEMLGLDPGEESLVAAAWWAEADPQLAVALGCGHDDAARRYASAPLLRLILEPFGVAVPPVVDEHGTLVRYGVLEGGPGVGAALRLTPSARLVLAGAPIAPLLAPAPLPERLAPARAALAEYLATGPAGPIVLRGPAGAGKATLACTAVADAGLVPLGSGRPLVELRLLARLGIGIPVIQAEEAAGIRWTAADGPLIALSSERSAAVGGYVVDVPGPSREERRHEWARALSDSQVPASDEFVEAIAARFAFTEGDITQTLARAQADAGWLRRPLDGDLVWSAARRQPEHALERLAALVRPTFTLDDLVLSDETHAKLRELVAHVDLQHVVLDRWGFRRRLPRGQGVITLFAGPPGTGKTMAAEAIADALRQDLYRIDLSAVVSKYIGETEKNLAAAFDEAERASAVLFFDEADALFGKRTEIRDAHDRYANLEVNYLLQRVETFTGLVILATNRQASLDEAFLRRLRFVIRFEAPDRVSRRALWLRVVPGGDRCRRDRLGRARGGGAHRRERSRAPLSPPPTSPRRTAASWPPSTSSTRSGASTRSSARRGRGFESERPSERGASPVRQARGAGGRKPSRRAPPRRDRPPARREILRRGSRERGWCRCCPRGRRGADEGAAMALIKGMLASFADPLLGGIPTIVLFQYNPTEVTRVFSVEAADESKAPSGSALNVVRPAPEDYTLKLEFDATDGLERGGPLTTAFGISPRLAAIEMLMQPVGSSLLGDLVGALLGGRAGLPCRRPSSR